jgi:hypothetical protein
MTKKKKKTTYFGAIVDIKSLDYTPIIQTTQEVEIWTIMVQGQSGEKVLRPPYNQQKARHKTHT